MKFTSYLRYTIFSRKYKNGTFILANAKRAVRKCTYYRNVCLINEVDKDEGKVTLQSLRCSKSAITCKNVRI